MVDWCPSLGLRDDQLQGAIASLLNEAGLPGHFSLDLLKGGANNRVLRVQADGTSTLLKIYFQHPDDPRDRLGAEFSFACFAWENGIRSLPRPLAQDRQKRLGLYEFVHGRQLLPHEVTGGMVRQALEFYRELNRSRERPNAQTLPKASEACFSIAAHLQCVEGRLLNLRNVDQSSTINREATAFIENDLSQVWRGVKDTVCKRADELGFQLDAELDRRDRCVSPSDFGFHNAIVGSDGGLRFIDFEYAGWDDPAKTVCDFFCQHAVPVPLDYYDMFVERAVSDLSDPGRHLQRIDLLFPLYRLKWCSILLNDFLPVGNARRRFAGGGVDQEEQKAKQLQKARSNLDSLTR